MLDDWQFDGKSLRKLALTNREKQVVLGTLLGNSSIIFPSKSSYPHLQMRESISKGGEWIRCKAEELKKFSRSKSFVADKDSYRWNSISDECWNYYYNLCYKNGKKTVNAEWLDQLQDYGIACWFMDKGGVLARSCHIRVSRLAKNSLENILEYFEIIDIPVAIKKHGGSTVINFDQEQKIRLFKLIGHCLPAFYRQN
jgi:hypothetical protein